MAGIKRRRFIAGAGAVVAGSACACGLSGCKMITGVGDAPEMASDAYKIDDENLRIFLDKVPELSKVGGSVKITDEALSDPLIIALTGEKKYLVASLKCTHGQRELEYRHDEKKFRCVSFGHSEFGLDGSRIKGPAEKPIKTHYASSPEGAEKVLIISIKTSEEK